LPLNKVSCDGIEYLIGSQNGAIEKIPGRGYSVVEHIDKSPTTVTIPTGTTIVKNFTTGTFVENSWLGCSGGVDITHSAGTYTVLRDMFVQVNYNFNIKLVLINPVSTNTASVYTYLQVSSSVNSLGVTTGGGVFVSSRLAYDMTILPLENQNNFLQVNGSWSGFVGKGTTLSVNVSNNGDSGVASIEAFGDDYFTIYEVPRTGFAGY
jgi:hypothetical protein